MIRAEFHLHTQASRDSLMTPEQVARACLHRRVNCVFVTDHDAIATAKALQSETSLKVVVSEEVTTTEGEIIGYFLQDRILPGLSPEQTVEAIRRQGGLVSVPHPFDRLRKKRITKKALDRIIDTVDMIETFNARNLFPADNSQAQDYARRHGKLKISASDAHTPGEVGRSWVELDNFSSPGELLVSLRQARLHCQRSPWTVHGITRVVKLVKKLNTSWP